MSAAAPGASACARCQGALEAGDLRCALCGLACAAPRRPEGHAIAQILRCTECGAAVAYAAEVQAPRCRFCGAVTRLEQPSDPIDQADRVLPFAVTPEQAHGALRQWMSTLGFFRPSDLASSATVEGLHPLWWAGWLVNAQAFLSWTADSNAGARRSAWAPHAGQTQLPFQNLLVSASRGLTLDEAGQLAAYFQLGHAVASAEAARRPLGPQGATIEQFDAQRSAARRAIVDAVRATAAGALQQGYIPGSTFRNVHVAVLLHALETRRIALPTYVLAYRYRKRLYRAVVHGQDARCVFGKAPLSIGKILLVAALVVLALLAALTATALLGRR